MSLFGSPADPFRHGHYCGLYYILPGHGQAQKQYLPQVDLQAHTTILSTTSRTSLTQTFVNPSSSKAIREVRYTFPLYDGVSVVGFQCHVGDRTIVGEVKEKEKARAVFKEAVERGETAGLFEQLPDAADVFTTTVGNIPPGAKVVVKITYLGELKHDMEVDGIRFTIPNIICPRYGQLPNVMQYSADKVDAKGTGISITVDAEMAEGSFIQKIQSPTHPISISMGTTSFAPNAEPKMTKASASLSLGTAELETDFVLQIVAKDTGVPKAVFETHPTIPNQRALMATLVPKFVLPAEKPEIVFVCDQSGSMSGSRNRLAVQALKVFLKSLPVGVKFNICAFGSHFDFLWPNSVTYSQESLDKAMQFADTLDSNYGGTNILEPVQATIEKRYKDMPLEIMLLTDGEIWNQDALFQYLNSQTSQRTTPVRLFSLGIGNGVSHSLIEGVAKAGNGFSQVVGEGEKMDSKVVRMLKGALSPHVNDYTLEVKYSTKPTAPGEADDFEIVEKVADSLTVKLSLADENKVEEEKQTVGLQSETMRSFFTDYYQKKPISLFDQSSKPDEEAPPVYDETGESRYAHLPKVPVPKIIQAPQSIPSLFAFIRTNVYLLFGPDAPQATPKSVVLRGTSTHGPLELEIPIQILDTPSETIHQLAAKKAISELERGRGWLPEAKDESGKSIKEKHEGRFSDMVEREAVRLGVQFQVGGKWCSFVAVEKNKANQDTAMSEDYEFLDDEIPEGVQTQSKSKYLFESSDDEDEDDDDDDEQIERDLQAMGGAVQRFQRLSQSCATEIATQNNMIDRIANKSDKVDDQIAANRTRLARITQRGEKLDSLQDKTNQLSAQSKGFFASAKKQKSSSLFGLSTPSAPRPPSTAAACFPPPPARAEAFGSSNTQNARTSSSSLFGSFSQAFHRQALAPTPAPPSSGNNLADYQQGIMVLEQQNKKRLMMARAPAGAPATGMAAQPPSFGAPPAGQSLFGAPQSSSTVTPQATGFGFGGRGRGFNPAYSPAAPGAPSSPFAVQSSAPMAPQATGFGQAMSAGQQMGSASLFGSNAPSSPPQVKAQPTVKTGDDLLQFLIALQTFEGSWEWTSTLFATVGINEALAQSEATSLNVDKKVFATAFVIAVFEKRLTSLSGSWELVVEKAKEWLGFNTNDVDGVITKAGALVGSS